MKDNSPFHVLLVEDNPGDAVLIEEFLEVYAGGIQLEHVTSMAAAKEYIAGAAQLDAVLLDLSLPDSSGLETLRNIHDFAPQFPVVVLTGLDDEEVALQAVREGAQDYLVKGEIDEKLLKRTLSYSVERKLIQDQLRREKEFTAAILRNSYDGIAVVAGSGRFKFISPGMRPILHIGPDEDVAIETWADLKIRKKEERAAFLDNWKQLLSGGESFEMIVEIALLSGGRHWSRLHLAAMEDNDFIMNGQDVTLDIQTQDQLTFINELLAKQNEQLQKMATTDQLTGVLNRSALYGIAEQQWSRAVRKGECFSVILMDIDHFKLVNDTHGHLVGDMVLERMGYMLNTLTRPYDQIGRWGGEEFLVMLPGTSCDDALMVAERMRAEVADMAIFVDDETTLKITSSFGVAGREKTGVTHLDNLFLLADKALYQAKDSGRNKVCRHRDA